MSKESKLPAAAGLLLASRMKPGSSGAALMFALGKHPLVVQGEMLKAGHRNLSTPSQLLMPEGKPEPVIAEAVVRTRNPLKSIAELGPMVRDARKAMKMKDRKSTRLNSSH